MNHQGSPLMPAQARTWLRVGRAVYPVYGDELRGWSPRAEDFRGGDQPGRFVYASIDELFFALVNMAVSGGVLGQASRN
jgi:hypothetical protein